MALQTPEALAGQRVRQVPHLEPNARSGGRIAGHGSDVVGSDSYIIKINWGWPDGHT